MLPEDCAKQWEVLLLLIASEEKKIDRTNDNEIDTMNYFLKNEGVKYVLILVVFVDKSPQLDLGIHTYTTILWYCALLYYIIQLL